MKIIKLLVAMLIVNYPMSVGASNHRGIYTGIGYSFSTITGSGYSADLDNKSDLNNKSGGKAAFIGYRIIKYVAVEASYRDFGRFDGVLHNKSTGTDEPYWLSMTSTNIYAVGLFPMPRLTDLVLHGRLGFSNIKFKDGPTRYHDGSDSGAILIGLGMDYWITRNMFLRIDASANLFSTGYKTEPDYSSRVNENHWAYFHTFNFGYAF